MNPMSAAHKMVHYRDHNGSFPALVLQEKPGNVVDLCVYRENQALELKLSVGPGTGVGQWDDLEKHAQDRGFVDKFTRVYQPEHLNPAARQPQEEPFKRLDFSEAVVAAEPQPTLEAAVSGEAPNSRRKRG